MRGGLYATQTSAEVPNAFCIVVTDGAGRGMLELENVVNAGQSPRSAVALLPLPVAFVFAVNAPSVSHAMCSHTQKTCVSRKRFVSAEPV